ncbi:gluconate 2-dehydrogenase subunit 3 family protein [bacterium]|nr:gluconate 2-dehydrogenase subunit 3 family protein [bacterium]
MPEYQPRFFNHDDFEGLIAIIDTMIETKGQDAVLPRMAAQRVDEYLSSVDAPAVSAIRLAIDAIDSWYMPLLLAFQFGRFRDLSVQRRRKVLERIIDAKGLFKLIALTRDGARDAARTLKLLSSVGYYSSPEGMRQVGYLPVEERPRFRELDQAPPQYPDPFPQGGAQ